MFHDLGAALDACRAAVRCCADGARSTGDEVLKIALVEAALKINRTVKDLEAAARVAGSRTPFGAEPSREGEVDMMFRSIGGA